MAERDISGDPVTSRRGFFWVGVERAESPFGTVPRGPMYVQWEAPVDVRHPYPLVLIHGGGGQGTDYLGTPDGRPGWASHLLAEGYTVYVVDRPGHGRSPLHPDVLGAMGAPFSWELAQMLFTGPTEQWPGSGELDDPTVDQFVAGTGPMLQDFAAAHALEQSRGAALLDRIGPAVVISHSAGGPVGWLMADARPDLVKAIVAIEPLGPPFAVNPQMGFDLEWGLSASPMTFDPPPAEPAELQGETPRTLTNLAGIPIAVVSTELSPFAPGSEATVEFLQNVGCDAEHVELHKHGVTGNGHMIMLERNSRETLGVILDWLDKRTPTGP